MSPIVAALLGLLAGALLGAAAVATWLTRRRPEAPAPVTLHEDLQPILDVLRSAVAVIGPHDEIVAVNERAVASGVVVGSRLAPEALDLVRACRRGAQGETANVERASGGGRAGIRWAVRVLPLADERVFLVVDDRTEALRAAESGRDFVTNVTHELKTPIGAIALMSEALELASDDPEAVRRFSARIHVESQRLDDLVRQIIALSRLQSHPGRATASDVDVDALVADVIGDRQAAAERRGISLASSGEAGLVVRGDEAQLRTALENLVQNALNYSDAGARVVVARRASADGDLVEIAVSDNGIGIAPYDQRRIFERFFRVDPARSRATGGTGLGLSIVREIAEGNGGEVVVWSAVGAGSTFTLRLPAARLGESL